MPPIVSSSNTSSSSPNKIQFPSVQSNNYDVQASQNVAKSIFDMARDLARLLIQTRSSNKFQIFSPISIAAALNMVLLGAKGRTYEELMSVLGYKKCMLPLYC